MRNRRISKSSRLRSRHRKFEYLYSVEEMLETSDFLESEELSSDYEEDVDREFSPYLSEYEEEFPGPIKTRSLWLPFLGWYTWTPKKRSHRTDDDDDSDED